MRNTFLLLLSVTLALVLASCNGKREAEPACAENPVVKTIMERRSIRKYQDRPVDRAQMDTIIRCGLNAPNGMNRQDWAVRVVDNPEYLNGITSLFLEKMGERGARMAQEDGWRNMFRNAPTVVFIAAPEGGDLNIGLLGENMILAAWSMGIGSCCLGGPIAFMRDEAAAPYVERLKLPEGYRLVYAIGMGYADESPEAKPRDLSKAFYVE